MTGPTFESHTETRMWVRVGRAMLCVNDLALAQVTGSSVFVTLKGAETVEIVFKGQDDARSWYDELWKTIGEACK